MKKTFTFLVVLGLAFSASAQTIVSTTAQNKKVVLEEFTGIHCTYCPDGHKRANELKAANAGNVFLVNIHAGGYATPAAGEPDLRTTEGTTIDGASGLTGYPAGSVSRVKSPRAEGRGTWAATAATVLAQSSPVNVGVKSYFDRATRVLTTDVEVYYTGNSATSTDKLTVMLTQDNILGPQTGGTTFYPENYVGDLYKHNHVLRMVLSPDGAWGETISTTTSGTLVTKQYVTTLPAAINGVPLTFYNLDVVAFVSEGTNNNIMSGAEAKVEFDPTGAVDLSIANKTNAGSGFCVGTIAPSVEVTNKSTSTVTSFDVTLNVGNQSFTKSFSGSLAPNGKATVTFDQSIVPRGEYAASITGFNKINGGAFFDTDLSNDNINITGLGFQNSAFTYGKFGFNGIMDANTGRAFDQNVQYSPVFSSTTPLGQTSTGAVRYYLHSSWGLANKPGSIMIGEADFTNITDPQVSYWYAYSDGGLGGTAPSVEVYASPDCGASWSAINTTVLPSTGEPADPAYLYTPKSEEYKQIVLSLSQFAGKKVLISINGVPGTSGNAMYLDEIEVGSAQKIASVYTTELAGVNVYPNPANDVITISLANGDNAIATVMDIQGNVIFTENVLSGKATINTSDIATGVYMIQISNGTEVSTKKITVAH